MDDWTDLSTDHDDQRCDVVLESMPETLWLSAPISNALVGAIEEAGAPGMTHVLGIALLLPVLKEDGTDVLCRVLVERASTTRGPAAIWHGSTPPQSGPMSVKRLDRLLFESPPPTPMGATWNR